MKHRKVVARALAMLRETWPKINITKASLEVWSLVLCNCTDAQIMIGVELLTRYHTYGQPAPAHLLSTLRGKSIEHQVDESHEPWQEWMAHTVSHKTIVTFVWEEHGDQPPGGLTNDEAREVLLEGRTKPPAITDGKGPSGIGGLLDEWRDDQ